MWSIVTDWVVWSVGLSVTVVSPAKTAEPIETPTDAVWVGDLDWPGNHVFEWGPDTLWEGAILRG